MKRVFGSTPTTSMLPKQQRSRATGPDGTKRRTAAKARRASAVMGLLVAALLSVLAGCSQNAGLVAEPAPPKTPTPPTASKWTTTNVGNVQIDGKLQAMSAAELQVTASGADIWGTADSFYFVYEPFTGDVDIRTYVKSLERTNGWSKAGVMIRNGTSAGAVHAYMDVTPGGAAEFIWRSAAGGISRSTVKYSVGVPSWVRVERKGTTLTGYVSKDGTAWTEVGSASVPLDSGADVGLAVTSHDASQSVQTVVSDLSARVPGSSSTTPTPAPTPTPTPTTPSAANWICPSQPLAPAYQPTFYVSTTGSDNNSGRTTGTPFKTLQRAADAVAPGDVVWIRGGTYSANVEFRHSGTASAPIVFESYPGECATLDGSGLSSTQRPLLNGVSYNVLRNLKVRNSAGEGILLSGGGHNLLSNILTYDNYYSGITNLNSSNNDFQYIVSHDNSDAPGGGNADGMSISSGDGNHVSQCVLYNNSDDGLDTWKSTNTLVERCVSFHNGFQGGDGNGFKAGGNNLTVHTVMRDNVAFDNSAQGFDYNTGLDVRFDNNTAYGNHGFGFIAAHGTLRNNLAISNSNGPFSGYGYGDTLETNSWDVGIRNPGFVSTDSSSDAFLGLSSNSPAVNAGTDIGLSYSGSAPDIGALQLSQTIASLVGVSVTEAKSY